MVRWKYFLIDSLLQLWILWRKSRKHWTHWRYSIIIFWHVTRNDILWDSNVTRLQHISCHVSEIFFKTLVNSVKKLVKWARTKTFQKITHAVADVTYLQEKDAHRFSNSGKARNILLSIKSSWMHGYSQVDLIEIQEASADPLKQSEVEPRISNKRHLCSHVWKRLCTDWWRD